MLRIPGRSAERSTLLDLVRRRIKDDKVHVRKAAIQVSSAKYYSKKRRIGNWSLEISLLGLLFLAC